MLKGFLDEYKSSDAKSCVSLRSILRQCGYPHNSLSYLSSGNVLLLTLVTSEEKNFPGFRANYSQIPLNTGTTGSTQTTVING